VHDDAALLGVARDRARDARRRLGEKPWTPLHQRRAEGASFGVAPQDLAEHLDALEASAHDDDGLRPVGVARERVEPGRDARGIVDALEGKGEALHALDPARGVHAAEREDQRVVTQRATLLEHHVALVGVDLEHAAVYEAGARAPGERPQRQAQQVGRLQPRDQLVEVREELERGPLVDEGEAQARRQRAQRGEAGEAGAEHHDLGTRGPLRLPPRAQVSASPRAIRILPERTSSIRP
jgi:hypothetical protein